MKEKILLLLVLCIITSGCTINLSSEKNTKVEEDEEQAEEIEEEKIDNTGKNSSVKEPLSIGSTGIASKYNTKNDNYNDVDVKLLSIEDNSLIDKYNEENPEEAITVKDGYKLYIIKYEVSLNNYETESFGTNATLDAEIIDTSGNQFLYDKVKQIIEVTNIEETSGLNKNETGTTTIAFQVPDNYKEILIILGNTKNTRAYFKI